MAISIDSLQILQKYLLGVLERADHHAGNVEGVSLTLAGAIIWKSTQEIEVREYKGETANMIWFGLNNIAMQCHIIIPVEKLSLKKGHTKGNC